jgi:hypothetical protein
MLKAAGRSADAQSESDAAVLASNADQFTPLSVQSEAEPYVALRLLATVLSVLAVLVMTVGGLIALLVILGSLGSAGTAARFAPGAVPMAIAGTGLLGGVLVLLGAALLALLLWARAQSIRVLLSIEGHAREAAAIQRAMLAELRRNASVATMRASAWRVAKFLYRRRSHLRVT